MGWRRRESADDSSLIDEMIGEEEEEGGRENPKDVERRSECSVVGVQNSLCRLTDS
jgi:hypothetical protein